MVNHHDIIDNMVLLYSLVGSNDFIVRDIPLEYRDIRIRIGRYEHDGYLVKSGSIKLWSYDRYKDIPTYRISSRYLQKIKDICMLS